MKLEQVEVPMHEITEVKRGKRVQRKKKVLSKLRVSKNGYVKRNYII